MNKIPLLLAVILVVLAAVTIAQECRQVAERSRGYEPPQVSRLIIEQPDRRA